MSENRIRELEKENKVLKSELNKYYKRFDCNKCSYHDYDYNYDEFNIDQKYEICTKGNHDSMLNNHSCSECMDNSRFSIEREVSLITNKVVKLDLIDKIGDLPRLSFTNPTELYEWEKAFMKEWITLKKENNQLKQENQRMTNKLNKLALEFLNHDMITMGKATEICEMCYHDFLKYRAEHGNPMELQL